MRGTYHNMHTCMICMIYVIYLFMRMSLVYLLTLRDGI